MGHDAPPTSSTTTSLAKTVGCFLLGAVMGVTLPITTSLALSIILKVVGVNIFGAASPGREFTSVFAIFLGTSTALAGVTYLLFRDAVMPTMPYAIGAGTPLLVAGVIIAFSREPLAAAFLAALALAFTIVARVAARRGLRAHALSMASKRGDRCAHCDYDLSATAEGLVCPECGGTLRYDTKA